MKIDFTSTNSASIIAINTNNFVSDVVVNVQCRVMSSKCYCTYQVRHCCHLQLQQAFASPIFLEYFQYTFHDNSKVFNFTSSVDPQPANITCEPGGTTRVLSSIG